MEFSFSFYQFVWEKKIWELQKVEWVVSLCRFNNKIERKGGIHSDYSPFCSTKYLGVIWNIFIKKLFPLITRQDILQRQGPRDIPFVKCDFAFGWFLHAYFYVSLCILNVNARRRTKTDRIRLPGRLRCAKILKLSRCVVLFFNLLCTLVKWIYLGFFPIIIYFLDQKRMFRFSMCKVAKFG